jgi:hypothetical protein
MRCACTHLGIFVRRSALGRDRQLTDRHRRNLILYVRWTARLSLLQRVICHFTDHTGHTETLVGRRPASKYSTQHRPPPVIGSGASGLPPLGTPTPAPRDV